MWPAPIKIPGHWVTNELPWQATFHTGVTAHCWGIDNVTLLGKDPWKLASGPLRSWLHAPFSFADFAFYPFAVTNHSHESNDMMGPESLPSELLNWKWPWEPWHSQLCKDFNTLSAVLVQSDTDIFSMQLIDVWHYILTCSLCSVVQCVIFQISKWWFSLYYKWRQQEGCWVLNGWFYVLWWIHNWFFGSPNVYI